MFDSLVVPMFYVEYGLGLFLKLKNINIEYIMYRNMGIRRILNLDEVCSHSDDVVSGKCPLTLLAEMKENIDGDAKEGMARSGTTNLHVGCFLLTSHPSFVEGQRIGLVLADDDCH